MAQNPTPSRLDQTQILQRAFEEADDRLRTNATATIESGSMEVIITNTDDDILVYGNDGTTNRKIKTDAAGELQVDVLSSALPTGAATSANQVTEIASLASIEAKIPSNLTVSSTRLLVDGSGVTQPVSGTVAVSNFPASQNVVVTSIPEVEIKNDSGNPIPISDAGGSITVDGTVSISGSVAVTGTLTDAELRATPVPVSASSLPLPSGAATSANQTNKAQYTRITDGTDDALVTAAGELNVLATAQPGVDIGDVTINNASGASAVNIQDGGNSITVDGSVTVSGTIAATQSGTWNINDITGTVSLPTGASTSALQTTGNASLSSLDSKFNTLGQKTMANSAPVVLASDQSAIPVTDNGGSLTVDGSVSVSNFPATQAVTQSTSPWVVSGTVTANAGTGTFAISAASLPLPTGAATAALQTQPGVDIGDVTVNNAAGASAVNIQDGGNSITVDGTVAATQSGTWNINNISGTVSLPTGAATETTLSALNAKFNSLGQKTMANSAPVVIASDQTVIPVSDNGGSLTVDGSISITGAATATVASVTSSATNVTLFASNSSAKMRTVYNDSSRNLYLKFGTTASATSFTVLIANGGYYEFPLPIYTGQVDGLWNVANGFARTTEY